MIIINGPPYTLLTPVYTSVCTSIIKFKGCIYGFYEVQRRVPTCLSAYFRHRIVFLNTAEKLLVDKTMSPENTLVLRCKTQNKQAYDWKVDVLLEWVKDGYSVNFCIKF